MLDRYVGWVETYRETHLSFVRGAAGGDPWVAEVYEETRERLVDVALTALELPDDALRRQLVLRLVRLHRGPRRPVGAASRRCPAPTCSSCCATSWTGWSD